MKKRFLSVALVLCMALSMLPSLVPAKATGQSIFSADIVSVAKSLVGQYPYVYGGESPDEGGFDCTGLVYYVYHTRLGHHMTLGQARSKSGLLALGQKITNKADFLPGDILQFTYPHVAIYIGNSTIVEAAKPGTNVREASITYRTDIEYAVRLPEVNQNGLTTQPEIPQYFSCNVRIDCVNGQVVNLYNNPGDTSRADYFSKGQSVQSTYGAKLSDGSTWYRISASSSGVVKTFWLKYENSKMTVSNIESTAGSSTADQTNFPQYFNCNVRIDCVNGQVVNLYNNPGDTSRADYFSKGQSAQSTYGAKLSDESTWYRISASSNGVVKTFWLKYESSKMTVTHIEPTYTIYFNANGGSVSTSSKTVTTNSTYGTLPTPTRTGYKFDGWYTSSSGGSQITSSSTVNLSGNQTLYAHWTEQSYTVSFNTNGGSVSTSSKTVINGDTYGNLPTPTRSGYAFEGWYTSSNGGSQITSSTTVTLSENQTLYAHWEKQSYTVNFNANGGSISTSSKTITNGDTYGNLPIPTRSGYTFEGWYTSSSGGNLITSSTVVNLSGSQTLYAHWEEVQTQPQPTRSFTDVQTGAYYADAVAWAVEKGITAGTSATTFSPNANVTRGQAVTFLWRAMGMPSPKSVANPFSDVKFSDYYYEAVLWAVEKGITYGTSATSFSPNGNVTRGQMVAFLYRTVGEPGKTGTGAWYADAENWANRQGLLNGTAVAYTTNGDCPRSDVVYYLWKASDTYKITAEDSSGTVGSYGYSLSLSSNDIKKDTNFRIYVDIDRSASVASTVVLVCTNENGESFTFVLDPTTNDNVYLSASCYLTGNWTAYAKITYADGTIHDGASAFNYIHWKVTE